MNSMHYIDVLLCEVMNHNYENASLKKFNNLIFILLMSNYDD